MNLVKFPLNAWKMNGLSRYFSKFSREMYPWTKKQNFPVLHWFWLGLQSQMMNNFSQSSWQLISSVQSGNEDPGFFFFFGIGSRKPPRLLNRKLEEWGYVLKLHREHYIYVVCTEKDHCLAADFRKRWWWWWHTTYETDWPELQTLNPKIKATLLFLEQNKENVRKKTCFCNEILQWKAALVISHRWIRLMAFWFFFL